MFGKNWEMIKRGLAVALSASLLAGTMTVSASLPTAAASGSRVETDAKGGVTINLDGREVWQAASAAMQKADAVTGDIADRIMAQTGSNGNPVVLEDDIYEMELPENALRGLPAGLGMDMYISAGAEDAAEDYTAAEEEEAATVTAEVSSASDLAHTATGVAERPVRDFFASNMFSLVRENDDSAPAGTAAAAGGEGYELNGSEHIYFVLSNATDQDVNYTIKMGGMELLKTKVLKSHGNTEGVIGATVSSLIGIPDSASGMTRATGSDMATASGLMGETELTDDVVAKVVRTTLKNFFVIYRSEETDLGTKVMVVTTADTKFKAEGGGLLSGRTEKPVLHVEDVPKGTKKYEDAEKALRDNDVDHADFAAVDISFRKTAGGTEDYEPYEGQIVNVRIETRAIADFNPDSVSIQHHLEDGTLETVAGTTRKTKQTFIEINDDTADGAVSGTTTVSEDNQTQVTVESDNDGNVYTFDEDANRALMQKQLDRAKSKSSFRMSVGSGETRLENDTESETGAPKKTTSAKTAAKTANNTSTATTVSSNVDANGIKTEVREEKGKGGIKVEDGRVVADFVVDSFSIYTIVETETITRRVITASGESFDISVTYGPEAKIPWGSVLEAEEILEGTAAYDNYIEKSLDALSSDEVTAEITYARFFDIRILYNGVKIEPSAPVEVTIEHADAIRIDEEETLNMVHFADKGIEVIEDVDLSDDGKTTVHEQDSFSVTGEVAGRFSGNNWPTSPAGDYVLVVYSGNGAPYYIVNSSGGLVEVEYDPEQNTVTIPDSAAATTDDLDDYWWTYFVSGGNHRLTSVTNPNNMIYPLQTEDGSALSYSTNSPGANQGFIYRGNTYFRYCVAINNAGTSLISSHVTYYNNRYTYPGNAAHFLFVNNFHDDVTGAYGTAASTILTGNSKTLRMAEVTTSDEELIDFEGFSWRSSNTSVVTVSTDPNTDAPIATGVNVGTARIIGTRTNEHDELDEVIWTVTVKDKTSNSIVFLHQPQDNGNFANQDNIRPHDGYGATEPTNYVKFVVALADADGNIILYDGKPNVELPTGSVVPDRYEFELDSTATFTIEEDTLSGISVPGYSYAGTYAYFGWYNNTDLENMAVVDEFKNMGAISSRYSNYYSVLGFKTSRGNPQYQDYAQTAFGERGYGYYAYNPTGVLMIVLQPVSEDITFRTSYHNDYVPGGNARINIVDTTRAIMHEGDWIPDEYRHDWYGEAVMTAKTGSDLIPPEDGYEFVGWFDSVDAEGNGTGNEIIGVTEGGNYYATKDGERIIIRQNNDIYAKWQLVRGTLTITKAFTGDLSDADFSALKNALEFTVSTIGGTTVATKTGADMTWNGRNGSVDLTGLAVKEYYVITENESAMDIAGYERTTTITYPGGATAETGVRLSKTAKTTVAAENNYVGNKTLTVTKSVTGNMGNKAKEFTFTIVLTNSAKDIEDCLADYAGKYVKGSDGQYTVTIGLRDTDSFTVSLPGGTQYSIAENDYSSEGYTTTYTNYTKDSTVELTADTTVTVTNHRAVTVPTGINTDLHFWKWLIGACFLALIGAAMYGRKKRRM